MENIFIEAKYFGTWNSGKRQGPGELQFNQYRFVGKFQDNYVRILLKEMIIRINICFFTYSQKVKVNLYSKMDINKMENTI